MQNIDDRRLIEDYLPIQAISAEASREKSVRKGHISTLHLWWVRRPLVACRAAVYGALVPATRFQPANGPEEKRGSLGRANAAKFVERLCKYPGDARVIAEAQQHILEAHAERLTQERRTENGGTGILPVTVEHILQGRAPRPKVLDMFAGGGAIPLEALRLGCEAYALDLNPVAHIIELCTLVYPQKYGKPDATAKGSAKDGTWAGLAEEVRYWGQWVLGKVKAEIGDLYPLIPDPANTKAGGPGFQPGHSQFVQGDLFITRRNLPHWQLGGSIYFVTFRTTGLELPPEARKLVLDACRHFDGQRYALWAAVVMPDHVHLLLQPKEQALGQWWSLSDILHSIKSFTANQINKLLKHEGSVWQDESFDRIVRDEEEFLEKWNYIRNNPVKRGLCSEPEAWDAFHEKVKQASELLVGQASSLPTGPGKMPGPPNKDQTSSAGPGFQPGQKDLPGYLTPVAYLWTRTVRCKNPSCEATVPLVKQTWLCKKKGHYVALKMIVLTGSAGFQPADKHSQDGCATKKVNFAVVKSDTEAALGFNPAQGSEGGNATCPFCGTVADADYVQTQGKEKRVGAQLMAVVCTQPAAKGKTYLSADDLPADYLPNEQTIRQRIDGLCKKTGFTVPHEPISPSRPSPNARGLSAVTRHGLTTFSDLFTPRQMLCLLTFVATVREAHQIMVGQASSLPQSPGKMPGLPIKIQTMWGWLAWQIGGEKAFGLVAGHDKDRVAPGGDIIQQLLTQGANGRPVLLLLDEVLKYMERAAAVAVLDSTLQRQAKDFFQSLTVEVSNSKNAAMVYSLQWSAREALGNIALLQEMDKLAARVDQLREPVTGDEILPILQRRLLGATPDSGVANGVAVAYQEVIVGMQRAYAETPTARQQAEEEGIQLRGRLQAAYPFHPALIDVMRERWTAVDSFQRTRGALRFLASCLASLKKNGGAQPLLGPAEIPLKDTDVRIKMLKELGVQNDYDPVITADIEGPNARAKRIDERLARDNPALASVRPAIRLATAILIYSFGGLRREGNEGSETLPPGVTESELLATCVGPDLDNITATAVLSELRTVCLYLHYDGVRYCFKKDPNVTKLIEDAENDVARHPEEVKGRIKEMLTQRLTGRRAAEVWPVKTQDMPDEEPTFLIGYLPLEFAMESKTEQERLVKEFLAKYGDRPRKYRNGLGLAIPEKKQIEALRRAVRYLLAIERVENKKQQLRLSKDQLDQLRERRRTEEAAAESAFRALYTSVWLPRVEGGTLEIERVEVGGRPLQATGIHERMMELLTNAGTPKVHSSVTPRKIVERLRLGEAPAPGEALRLGVKATDILEAFFAFLEPPRLDSAAALRKALVRGIAESVFAYTSGYMPTLGPDGRYQLPQDKVTFGRTLSDDEIDFDSGFLIMPPAIPEAAASIPSPEPPPPTVNDGPVAGDPVSPSPPKPESSPVASPVPQTNRMVRLSFAATRDQVFKAFPAIANLAEKSDDGKLMIHIEASSQQGFDPAWLRNAVEEPLDEADIERQKG